MRVGLAVGLLCWASSLGGCLGTPLERCPSGRVCPAGLICYGDDTCVAPDELDVCTGIEDGQRCVVGGTLGACAEGRCLLFECGNGVLETGETCEPGLLESCVNLDFDRGATTCIDCTVDTRSCDTVGWGALTLGSRGELLDVDITASGYAMAGGGVYSEPVVLERRSGQWQRLVPPTVRAVVPVAAVSPNEVYAFSQEQALFFDGTAWTESPLAITLPLAAARSPSGQLVTVGLQGTGAGDHAFLVDGQWQVGDMGAAGLLDVWWASDSEAYAVGLDGEIFRYTASSTPQWTPMDSGTDVNLDAVGGCGPLGVCAAGGDGTILQLADDGDTWVPVAPGLPPGYTIAAITTVGVELWMGGLGPPGGIAIRFDGEQWLVTTDLPPIRALAGTSSTDLLAATPQGVLTYSGESWADSNSGAHIFTSGAAVPGEIFLMQPYTLGPGDVFRPADTVSLASIEGAGQPNTPVSLWARSKGELFVINSPTDAAHLIRWDLANGWTEGPAVPNAARVTGTDDAIYVVGPAGHFAVHDADGANPVPLTSPTSADLAAVWAGEGGAIAVGAAGTVVRLEGGSLAQVTVPTNANLLSVWGTSTQDFYAVGADFIAVHVVGDDAELIELPVSTRNPPLSPEELTGVDGTAWNDVFVVGARGSIFHYDGAAWGLYRSPALTLAGVSALPSMVLFYGSREFHRLMRPVP